MIRTLTVLALTVMCCCSHADSSSGDKQPSPGPFVGICQAEPGKACVRVVSGERLKPVEGARVFVLTSHGGELDDTRTNADGIAFVSREQPSDAKYVMAARVPYAVNGVLWSPGNDQYFIVARSLVKSKRVSTAVAIVTE
jgi:hypothetical protein